MEQILVGKCKNFQAKIELPSEKSLVSLTEEHFGDFAEGLRKLFGKRGTYFDVFTKYSSGWQGEECSFIYLGLKKINWKGRKMLGIRTTDSPDPERWNYETIYIGAQYQINFKKRQFYFKCLRAEKLYLVSQEKATKKEIEEELESNKIEIIGD